MEQEKITEGLHLVMVYIGQDYADYHIDWRVQIPVWKKVIEDFGAHHEIYELDFKKEYHAAIDKDYTLHAFEVLVKAITWLNIQKEK